MRRCDRMSPRSLEETCIRPAPDFNQLRRVLLRDGKPDFIPFYELLVDIPVQERLLGKSIACAADTVEFYYKAGYDCLPVWGKVDMPLRSLIDRSQRYPISDRKSFEEYPWPTKDSISYAEFDQVSQVLPEGMMVTCNSGLSGFFECLQSLIGFEPLCFMLIDDPELVQAVCSRLEEIFTAMYRNMASIDIVGAVVIHDDLGFKTQPLLRPDDLRHYILPVHKKLSEIGHAVGKPVILHSCGQLAPVMEEIIEEVKIDAKHSYEDSILSVTEAWKLYGERIAILGGYDVDRLCRSTEEEIRAYTVMLATEVGAAGGYALGSGNSIASYIPIEKYLTMLDEGWRLRN
jgi:uroporphyrinogen decarboxylase